MRTSPTSPASPSEGDPEPFEVVPGDPASPVLIHVPHASRHVPADVAARILLDHVELQAELDAMTDAHTDAIALAIADRLELTPWLLVNRTSRLVVDPERFPDPDQEEMTAVGMGAVYTRTSTQRPLRAPDPDHEQHLLERFFHPYAEAMTELVEQRRSAVGRVLVLDIHSYPRETLPYELHAGDQRPALCLGVDAHHTPAALVAAFRDAFDDVAVNEPFAGCYIPLAHHGRIADVHGLMLEIRRDTYLRDGRSDPELVAALADRAVTALSGYRSHRAPPPS